MLRENEISQLREDIIRLKKERNALIMAHYYQAPEIQDIADVVGDSLELARRAADTNADVIVLCGVHFMAESAAILSPDKIVLLPDETAGCPMADMVTGDLLRDLKNKNPEALVVSYVNTTAEVKAESYICCTSANAVKIVESIPGDKEIIFLPDRNLGSYVMEQTGRSMILWDGCCCVHDRVTVEDVLKAKKTYPDALILVHPECRSHVISMADCVSSTAGIIKFARKSVEKEFIIVTELGILHQLQKECPDKKFYLASQGLLCRSMKKTTLEKVKNALETMQPQVTVAPDIRQKALRSLERMLAVN